MKIRAPWLDGFLGYGIAGGIRAYMSTLRYEASFEAPDSDPLLGLGGPKIFVIWHESILAPIYLRAHCKMALLISRHRDADILASIARHAGFDAVRGSTQRGGSEALHHLAEFAERHHIVFTPDGPRGPRRNMAPGPVVLATRTGLPIVPIAFGYTSTWRMQSWDRFAVPRPFSGVRVRVGSPIVVARNLDRDGVETVRRYAENELNRCTGIAEAWAAGGPAPEGSAPVYRGHYKGELAPPSAPRQHAA